VREHFGLREELAQRCREQRIELPAPGRITRIVRSALHNAEETWFDTSAARKLRRGCWP
jgi:hypothetical protein